MSTSPVLPIVLIADDDPEWRDFLCVTIGCRYPLLIATTGDEALDLATRLQPAAIVLDVVMPESMDGFSTFCELRKRPATRNIPVVMCSAINRMSGTSFDTDLLEQQFGAAPSAFLEKPVRADDLLAAVEKALRGRKP